MSKDTDKAPEATPEATPTPKTHRRARGSAGGHRLKLTAPQRPGFVRRFVNNDPLRIAEMHKLGYDFAEADTDTDGLGTRIERHVGKDAEGKPIKAFLMETPVDQYQIGVAEKEDGLKSFEEAIRRGADTTGLMPNAYAPSSGQSSIQSGFTP